MTFYPQKRPYSSFKKKTRNRQTDGGTYGRTDGDDLLSRCVVASKKGVQRKRGRHSEIPILCSSVVLLFGFRYLSVCYSIFFFLLLPSFILALSLSYLSFFLAHFSPCLSFFLPALKRLSLVKKHTDEFFPPFFGFNLPCLHFLFLSVTISKTRWPQFRSLAVACDWSK